MQTDRLTSLTVFAVAASLTGFFSSCVNQAYDLGKPIDTSLNIQGDLSLPIGSSEMIKISKFLNFEDTSDGFIKTQDNGDFYLSFSASEGISQDFSIPAINIGRLEQMNGLDISLPTQGLSGVSGLPVINFDFPDGSKMSISINKDFNEERILELKALETNSPVNIKFGINSGKVSLCQGVKVIFPEYFLIRKQDESDNRFTISGSELTINRKIGIPAGNNVGLGIVITGIDFTRVPEGMGLVREGSQRKFRIEDNIAVSGRIEIDPADFSTAPSSLKMSVNTELNDLTIKSATAKVDISYQIGSQSIAVNDLPDFLNGENINLDIWNPVLGLKVQNETPLQVGFNATVKAFAEDRTEAYASLTLGENGDIVLPTGSSNLFFSRKGTHPGAAEGDIDYLNEGMGEILSRLPSKLEIDGITVHSVSDDFITLDLATSYSCKLDYSFSSELAFGKDLKIEYTIQDIKGLNSTFNSEDQNGLDLSLLSISFDMANTIPIGFALSAKPVDTEGNVLNGINVSIQGDIKGGTLDRQSISPVTILLTSTGDAMRKFDGLSLTVTGSSNAELEGVSLNANQSIQLLNIKARLVGEYTTNLK